VCYGNTSIDSQFNPATAVRFTLPGDRMGGFYGFMLRGPGFVAIRKLESGPAGKGGR